MKVGQLVLLIIGDGYVPPLGSIGTIIESIDEAGDFGVEFPDHPCPNPPGEHWYCHKSWLVPLDPDLMAALRRVAVATQPEGREA